MILPSNEECVRVLDEMSEFTDQLTQWERDFVNSCWPYLKIFSDKQKEAVARFKDKYDLK